MFAGGPGIVPQRPKVLWKDPSPCFLLTKTKAWRLQWCCMAVAICFLKLQVLFLFITGFLTLQHVFCLNFRLFANLLLFQLYRKFCFVRSRLQFLGLSIHKLPMLIIKNIDMETNLSLWYPMQWLKWSCNFCILRGMNDHTKDHITLGWHFLYHWMCNLIFICEITVCKINKQTSLSLGLRLACRPWESPISIAKYV